MTSAVLSKLDLILDIVTSISNKDNDMAIDTSKLLAIVASEKTDNASLRALQVQTLSAVADISKQLAAAIAANDPAALAQVQTDIDSVVSDLNVDDAATKAALAANVPAPAAGAAGAPAAGA